MLIEVGKPYIRNSPISFQSIRAFTIEKAASRWVVAESNGNAGVQQAYHLGGCGFSETVAAASFGFVTSFKAI
jgi:hypothetical protein